MARYFFHSANGTVHRDADGLEVASAHAAEVEAVRCLGEMLSEQPESLWPSRSLTITVTGLDGRVAFAVTAALLTGPER